VADIVWRTVNLPQGFAGLAYEAGLAVTGNATAITNCVVSSGSLPPGLAISADFVRITGTPTTYGTYTFTLTMTDTAGGVASPSFTIKVFYGSNEDDMRTLNLPFADQYARMWH